MAKSRWFNPLLLVLTCGATGLAACVAPSGPGCAGVPPFLATVTLTAAGTSPQQATVRDGGVVAFNNADTVSHQLASPCSQLNGPVMVAGTSWIAATASNQTCTFHDALLPSNAAFDGSVTAAYVAGQGC